MIAPNAILLIVWTYWPFIRSFYLSMTNWNPLIPKVRFIGLKNYTDILTDPLFWQIARNTLILALGTVSIGLVISLGLAVLLNQQLTGRTIWRFVYFSPHITTSTAIALVWASILDAQYGVVATLKSLTGLPLINPLTSPTWVLLGLTIVSVWKGIGFSTVVFLAALQGVDKNLKEAAQIDGANDWQVFRNVTFPGISPIVYFLAVVGIMGAIKTFDIVNVMTDGGTANASNVFVFEIYREAFEYLSMGRASALAVIMLFIIVALTLLQNWGKQRWVNY